MTGTILITVGTIVVLDAVNARSIRRIGSIRTRLNPLDHSLLVLNGLQIIFKARIHLLQAEALNPFPNSLSILGRHLRVRSLGAAFDGSLLSLAYGSRMILDLGSLDKQTLLHHT
jgi:hypothetical protein